MASRIAVNLSDRDVAVTGLSVDGIGGTDRLYTDTVTQQRVTSYGIRHRAVELKSGKLIDDPFSVAVQGTKGGSNALWVSRSKAAIDAVPDDKKQSSLVFLGDSIIHHLTDTGNAAFQNTFGRAKANTINRGMVGDTTSQVLYRIREQGMLDVIDAKAVMLDINSIFNRGRDSKYYSANDTVHLNSTGYGVWIRSIYEILGKTNGSTLFIY